MSAAHYTHRGNNVPRFSTTYARVLAYVAAYQPCSFETLFVLFADKGVHPRPRRAFRSRLVQLEQKELLVSTGRQAMRLWSLAPGAVVPAAEPEQPAAAPQPVESGYRVPPRQHNVMAGTYVPTAAPVLRRGALDFKQVPSVGHAC